jgi:hypothetical protein
MHDPVNQPQHYCQGGIEAIEAIEASMSQSAFHGFLKGNILKYMWRYEHKNGVEDLHKAQWYLTLLIEDIEANDRLNKLCDNVYESVKAMEEKQTNYDPDDYMISGCTDGFCPMPTVRQGPSEPMFAPVSS